MDTFQHAKDTFYTTLRDRLAALNGERTTLVRGAQRPAVLVEENEIAGGADPVANEMFVLRWTEHAVDVNEAVPLVREEALKRWPALRPAFADLAGKITADDMRAMNEAVDGEHRDAADVVREYREKHHL